MDLLIVFIISMAVTIKLTIWTLNGAGSKKFEHHQKWDRKEYYIPKEKNHNLF